MILLSNKITAAALAAVIMAAPLATFAATTDKAAKVAPAGFCTMIDTVTTKVHDRVTKVTEKVTGAKGARAEKMKSGRTTRDANLAKLRTEAAAKRTAQFTALNAKASTTAQKTAVATFEDTITAAITARHTAIDAAIKTYREGVDALVTSKFSGMDADVVTLEQAITAAGDTAKASCASGQSGATVRTTYMASVKAAHDAFKADATATSVKSQIQALDTARKNAIEAAEAKFKADAEVARTTLKAALAKK